MEEFFSLQHLLTHSAPMYTKRAVEGEGEGLGKDPWNEKGALFIYLLVYLFIYLSAIQVLTPPDRA